MLRRIVAAAAGMFAVYSGVVGRWKVGARGAACDAAASLPAAGQSCCREVVVAAAWWDQVKDSVGGGRP